jgi:hypothetical protein
VPSGLAKQPPVSLIPPPKVDVAVPVTVIPSVEESPSVLIPPVNVEVAVVVEVITPVVRLPMLAEPEVSEETAPEKNLVMVAKRVVLVALVVVELSAMKVLEAKSPDCAQRIEEVAETATPKLVEGVKEYWPVPI